MSSLSWSLTGALTQGQVETHHSGATQTHILAIQIEIFFFSESFISHCCEKYVLFATC